MFSRAIGKPFAEESLLQRRAFFVGRLERIHPPLTGEIPWQRLLPKRKVDLPPKGNRNPDPITDAPGSHPIETGIGAAVAGVATGMAVADLPDPSAQP